MSSKATIRPVYLPESRFRPGDAGLERLSLDSADKAAFERLATRYDRAILGFFLHLTGSEAEALDLCRATFLAAYRTFALCREQSIYVWLFRTAVEQWFRRSHGASANRRPAAGSSALSDRERVVFCLKSDEHLGLATVARILDEPGEVVIKTFSRAVAKLRMTMAPAQPS